MPASEDDQTTVEEACLRILTENNRILKENNELMKEIKETLRKIAINTS
jgi:hypothetical protein